MKLLSKEQVGSLYAISSGLCYGFLGYFGVQLLKSNLSIANMLFWRFLVAAFFTFIILMFKGKNIFQPLTENLKIIFYGIDNCIGLTEFDKIDVRLYKDLVG
jgi:drug/metabolite transporter (DMT)-like permease